MNRGFSSVHRVFTIPGVNGFCEDFKAGRRLKAALKVSMVLGVGHMNENGHGRCDGTWKMDMVLLDFLP